METYAQTLINAGVAESRIADLEAAMEQLHKALCKLDFRNLRNFTRGKGILGQLDMYARHNQVRNVATDVHNMAIHDCYRNIDHDMFPALADKMFFLIKELAELDVPGAKMLIRSMGTIRRMEVGKTGLSWRLALQGLMNSLKEYRGNYYDGDGVLFIRTSHKYKTSLRMDDEFEIGYVKTLYSCASKHAKHDYDYGKEIKIVKVKETQCNDKGIRRALKDTYDMSGCTCAHDCCGCLSQHVGAVKCLDRENGIWAIEVRWSRNC